jgi:hypothetical protein
MKQLLRRTGPTQLWLRDIPLLRDLDANPVGTGYYYAMGSRLPTWVSATLMQSNDGRAFATEDASNLQTSYGYTTAALPAPRSPWTWDRVNSLTVKMSWGSLEAAAEIDVMNGANVLLVGEELVQFASATQNADGTWTLSNLLRGRRGTEYACASHHVGEVVLVPKTGLKRVFDPTSVLWLEYEYKAIETGQPIAAARAQKFIIRGRDLMPYSVVRIRGARDQSGNLAISWIRRTRIGGAWLNHLGRVPLAETREAYELEILDAKAAVVRTIESDRPAVAYSVADQVSDFGAPQSSVAVRVFQISEFVGRGFSAGAVL